MKKLKCFDPVAMLFLIVLPLSAAASGDDATLKSAAAGKGEAHFDEPARNNVYPTHGVAGVVSTGHRDRHRRPSLISGLPGRQNTDGDPLSTTGS